jgi:hypothetical protein
MDLGDLALFDCKLLAWVPLPFVVLAMALLVELVLYTHMIDHGSLD